MPKYDRNGRAEIFSESDYSKFFKALNQPHHILLFSICRYTGERIGAVVQLPVLGVYADPANRLPRNQILFPKRTRKGKQATREVPVHDALADKLRAYQPPMGEFLFPSPKNKAKHLTADAVDDAMRRALERAGLSDRGFSTHSFRRTALTRLDEAGTSIRVIQAFSGHSDLAMLSRYIEVKDGQIERAIAAL